MKTKLFSLLVAAPLGLSACGGLAEDPEKPDTLAVINGTLAVDSGAAVPESVRVALVWRTDVAEDDARRGFNTAEDLDVTPEFPASFQLTLRNPPPASALFTEYEGFDSMAVGSVVAYEDTNGNGRLDLVASDATSFVDSIVGANEELLVVWFSEAPTGAFADALRDPQGNVPGAGYNLYRVDAPIVCETPAGDAPPSGEPGTPCESEHELAWLPIDAPFDLPITTDPRFNKLMCESPDEVGPPNSEPPAPNGGAPEGVPEGPFPAPGAAGLTCSPDGRSYTFESCGEVRLCEPDSGCAGALVELPDGEAPPAGWPCPSTP